MASAVRRSSATSVRLRALRVGDIGWVIQRHGELYAREMGWDERFEALVAGIAAKFVLRRQPDRERAWIAERAGQRLGSVFMTHHRAGVARLRLLILEPSARGLGIGRRLVRRCVSAARRAGYRSIILTTHHGLDAARSLYASEGFVQVRPLRYGKGSADRADELWRRRLS